MGTTFVTLGRDEHGVRTSDHARMTGFWMRDWMLELWLRLLALNLKEPAPDSKFEINIRDQWLLASCGGFGGCVPHDLEDITETPEGLNFVKDAITILSNRLSEGNQPLPSSALNLLGLGRWTIDIEMDVLRDVASAFDDLVNFRVSSVASTKKKMPGMTEPGIISIE